ncbi:MAG: universal stress protein [Thermodesulfobacteriota bacterium]|nr:universal stress protein [Thermodesulfobacteriota bacterium]
MKKIDKILVCVDFSEYSNANIGYAVELSGNSNAEILLCNVINQRDLYGVEMVSKYYPERISTEKYIKKTIQERSDKLKHIIKNDFPSMKSCMSIHISTGVPFEEILKTAEKENADLIVMGNKGRGNLSRTLFGSAAEKVFRHSSIPVVSVRSRDKFTRNRGDSDHDVPWKIQVV